MLHTTNTTTPEVADASGNVNRQMNRRSYRSAPTWGGVWRRCGYTPTNPTGTVPRARGIGTSTIGTGGNEMSRDTRLQGPPSLPPPSAWGRRGRGCGRPTNYLAE